MTTRTTALGGVAAASGMAAANPLRSVKTTKRDEESFMAGCGRGFGTLHCGEMARGGFYTSSGLDMFELDGLLSPVPLVRM